MTFSSTNNSNFMFRILFLFVQRYFFSGDAFSGEWRVFAHGKKKISKLNISSWIMSTEIFREKC